eukprot:30860-Pelagococcus_subviridis.AAC.2
MIRGVCGVWLWGSGDLFFRESRVVRDGRAPERRVVLPRRELAPLLARGDVRFQTGDFRVGVLAAARVDVVVHVVAARAGERAGRGRIELAPRTRPALALEAFQRRALALEQVRVPVHLFGCWMRAGGGGVERPSRWAARRGVGRGAAETRRDATRRDDADATRFSNQTTRTTTHRARRGTSAASGARPPPWLSSRPARVGLCGASAPPSAVLSSGRTSRVRRRRVR